MHPGQVFAELSRMDLEGNVQAIRKDSRNTRKYGPLFDNALERMIKYPTDLATRITAYMQMMSVVRKLYERFNYESALWFYREMKGIFIDTEMRTVYKM